MSEVCAAPRREPRVAMVMVDAMCLEFARAHLDHLPTLRRMLNEGAVAELSSSAAHMSASVWPTFASGEDPGVHGHYYPFQWKPDAMRFRRTSKADWIDEFHFEPFWHRLARRGYEAVAFDAGFTLNYAKSPCLEISNWSYQSSGAATASDPETLREIKRRFGRRPIGKEVPVPKTLRRSRRIRDSMIDAMRRKTDATLWLMEKKDWRLFIVGYFEIHRAGHNLLVVDGDYGSEADPDALLKVYKAQDRELARLLARIEDGRTTVALLALHGMAPNRAQDHFFDEILARLNAAWLKGSGAGAPGRRKPGLIARLRAHVPYGIQYGLAEALGEDVQDFVVNRTILGGLNFALTPSFRLASGGEAYIRFNIKGRERGGFFDPGGAALAQYRSWLEAELCKITVNGSAAPLVSRIVDAHLIFPGPRTDRLPDLIVDYAPDAPATAVYSPTIGEIRAHLETGRGGNHSPEAFVIVAGPGARHAAFASVSDIKDLGRFVEAVIAGAPSTTVEERARLATSA
jgi:predicted AlkP superfamily phosphohydrolase/phosphomutase